MPNRNLLPKHRLGDFKAWLVTQGHEHRPTTANYQVLQVRLKGTAKWHSIFYKDTGNPHYTVPDPLLSVTRQFIKPYHAHHHPAPRHEAPRQHPAQAEAAGRDPAPQGDDGSPPF